MLTQLRQFSTFMDPRFFLALNLEERLSALHMRNGHCDSDPQLGNKRLERWQNSRAFSESTLFREFLKNEKITEEQFALLLGQEAEQIQSMCRENPKWIELIYSALEEQQQDIRLPASKISGKVESTDDFLLLLAPFITKYRGDLRAAISDAASGSIEYLDAAIENLDALIEDLLASLLLRLRRMIQRTMILETNIARLQKRLHGDSSEERYRSYIRLLSSKEERLFIFLEYPVLARKCLEVCQQWMQASREFLLRFLQDFGRLQEFFSLGPARLCRARGSAGDAHKQGRSVHILEFDNKKKLVYKPRPLAVDLRFQELLQYFNQHGLEPKLHTTKVLDCHSYGWTEFIEAKSCQQEAELRRFYQRQGSLLAILYATSSTDLHLENLIACGENPVVVDLETVFHPEFHCTEDSASSVEKIAGAKYIDSVMSVGLLPTPVHAAGRSMDKSALGATANQELPFEVDGVTRFGTDEIHIAKVPGRIGEIRSRPALNDVPADVCNYRQELEDGFRNAYQLILELRSDLLGKTGAISKFAPCTVRAVIRPSAYYADLLQEALHPTFNRNSLDQDLIFKNLYFSAAENCAYLKTIPFERQQLMQGDIPYFTCKPGSRDLASSDGSVIKDVLKLSGFETCRKRIERMSNEDLDWQLWLLDASLASLSIRNSRLLARKGFPDHSKYKNGNKYLQAAIACADRLLETAVRENGECTWVCLNYAGGSSTGAEEHHYQLGICNTDLYRGTLGISLFLAYVYKITEETKYKVLAQEACKYAINHLAELKSTNLAGAFIGLASYLYVQLHLSQIFCQPERIDAILAQLPDLLTFMHRDSRLDLMAGSAGAIPILLTLARLRPQSSAMRLAIQGGEHILELAKKENETLFWTQLSMPRGFSHGHSGVAWALSELSYATNESTYLHYAFSALSHEQNLLNESWTDIPNSPDSVAWCHGAAGIALGRLGIYKKHRTAKILNDSLTALKAVRSAPRRQDHILCHGSLGNLDALICAEEIIPEQGPWKKEIEATAEQILKEIEEYGWQSNLPPQLIEPGLMVGLAGIGYGMLRIYEPTRVPSVLMLCPPPGLLN